RAKRTPCTALRADHRPIRPCHQRVDGSGSPARPARSGAIRQSFSQQLALARVCERFVRLRDSGHRGPRSGKMRAHAWEEAELSDRLTGLDTSFLELERGGAHMHIASTLIFEGPTPEYEELLDHVASRLHLVPRFRQKLRFVPFGLGNPV